MIQIRKAFGPHLVLAGNGSPPELLRNISVIFNFLNSMPEQINMTQISPPLVHQFREGGQGISGMVLIAESHISIHTWPEKGALCLDIFSCKDFDTEKAVKIAVKAFRIKEWSHEVFERGLEFGRNLAAATQHLFQERQAIEGTA
ncbi:MAG: S-adenosylmethionine decarboxylase proenzyme [Deltaproteobacteria bacterium RBG_13_58_19]|nr:MAG: S-adenosylmethionine decarboxylase proenzyme [Deltaproteobacteria bacterium RBG_13_58_19]